MPLPYGQAPTIPLGRYGPTPRGMLLRVADDYGFKIRTLQHVLEGHNRERGRMMRRVALAFVGLFAASQFLIHEQSVCCVPWDDAGAFLRFSATYIARDEAEEDALMAETVERLGRLGLRF